MGKPTYILIASLPRSRSAWLSTFLTQGNSFFWHDPSQFMLGEGEPDFSQFRNIIDSSDSPIRGCVDTGLSMFWPLVKDQFDGENVKFAYLYRDQAEIVESMVNMGFQEDHARDHIERQINSMVEMEINYPGRSIQQHDLGTIDALQNLQKEILPDVPFHPIRAGQLINLNIQIQFPQPTHKNELATNPNQE